MLQVPTGDWLLLRLQDMVRLWLPLPVRLPLWLGDGDGVPLPLPLPVVDHDGVYVRLNDRDSVVLADLVVE